MSEKENYPQTKAQNQKTIIPFWRFNVQKIRNNYYIFSQVNEKKILFRAIISDKITIKIIVTSKSCCRVQTYLFILAFM